MYFHVMKINEINFFFEQVEPNLNKDFWEEFRRRFHSLSFVKPQQAFETLAYFHFVESLFNEWIAKIELERLKATEYKDILRGKILEGYSKTEKDNVDARNALVYKNEQFLEAKDAEDKLVTFLNFLKSHLRTIFSACATLRGEKRNVFPE